MVPLPTLEAQSTPPHGNGPAPYPGGSVDTAYGPAPCPGGRQQRVAIARDEHATLCSRSSQPCWAVPHGSTRCRQRRVAIARAEHVTSRPRSAVALPSRAGGGLRRTAALYAADGASRSRETSTPRAVRAQQSLSPRVSRALSRCTIGPRPCAPAFSRGAPDPALAVRPRPTHRWPARPQAWTLSSPCRAAPIRLTRRTRRRKLPPPHPPAACFPGLAHARASLLPLFGLCAALSSSLSRRPSTPSPPCNTCRLRPAAFGRPAVG